MKRMSIIIHIQQRIIFSKELDELKKLNKIWKILKNNEDNKNDELFDNNDKRENYRKS